MHHSARPVACRRAAGFTLIEMMVATAVSGVLATTAYPTYAGAVQKMRRCEALVALMQVQQAEEHFRSSASRYATLSELGPTAPAASRHYTLTVDAATADGYAATAVATGAQAGDRHCRVMKASVDGAVWTTASGATDAADNDAQANRRCWNQ